MGWDGTYYGYYKKDCSMSHSKVSNFCVFWGLNIALKSPQYWSTELIISQCKVNVKIYLIHIMWNSQKKNSNCSVCGTGCRCCALHNFPFFFFPLSSTASRLRLILGGYVGAGTALLWTTGTPCRSALGARPSDVFLQQAQLSQSWPLSISTQDLEIGGGLRDGVRISEMYG